MEYIEREALRKSLLIGAAYLDEDTMMTVVNVLDCFPAADVAPVRHGRWIQPILLDDGHMHAECSNCHNVRIIDDYCSACGSIMDADVETD